MAKIKTLFAFGLCILLLHSQGYANDAPHNETFGISCASCHGKVLTFYGNDSVDDYLESPFWGGSTGIDINDSLDNYPINRLCQTCHWTISGFSATNAPLAKTHSSYHYTDEGGDPWSWLCIDCHDPHQQPQKNYTGNSYNDSAYLATGIISYATYDNESDQSTLTYSQNGPEFYNYRDGWDDEDRLNGKTYPGRGAIIMPDLEMKNFTYSIVSVNTAANQIVVAGNVFRGVYIYDLWTDPETYFGCPDNDTLCEKPQTGEDIKYRYFGIIYGQFIKQQVNGKTVRFYDKTGPNSFADGDATRDGICEVCHTQTLFFNNDSENPTLLHSNDSQYYKNETNCSACHHHEKGFAHDFDSGMLDSGQACAECHTTGKHVSHLNSGETCATCHDINNMRLLNDSVIDPRTRIIGYNDGNPIYPCDDCHNNGRGGPPNDTEYRDRWDDANYHMGCDGCHNGRPFQKDPGDEDLLFYTQLNDSCVSRTGSNDTCWLPVLTVNDSCYARVGSNDSCLTVRNKVMDTDGHHRLVGEFGIRQYYCYICHDKTTDQNWNLKSKHTNGTIDVYVNAAWDLSLTSAVPYYDAASKNCYNIYCHSDGTHINPEVRPYPWDGGSQRCNSCHGHDNASDCTECHTPEDNVDLNNSFLYYSAMPMYANEGPDGDKANTHLPHVIGQNKGCNECHADTVYGTCTDCHLDANDSPIIPSGEMGDLNHIKAAGHVNKLKTVKFLNDSGGTAYYDSDTRTCYNTLCHGSEDPRWGGELSAEICKDCHGSSTADIDDYGDTNGIQARINLTQWYDTGHGRSNDSGPYDISGNPAANFPTNGCWYCHDPRVSHQDNATNPFRLRQHTSFEGRFDKECAFCHMGAIDSECIFCHNSTNSLAIQLSSLPAVNNDTVTRPDHTNPSSIDGDPSCVANCHDTDANRHNVGSDKIWNDSEKADVKNQYVMMGVCLICHDENSGGQCGTCHEEGGIYTLGFDPELDGTRHITPTTAKASSAHFGYKHYYDYEHDGTWKGGKFCWDCHDPHGDDNIYMIQGEVTLESDGTFGIPSVINDSTGERAQAAVEFTNNHEGIYYAGMDPGPYNKICNVCHSGTTGDNNQFAAGHYTSTSGDGHNLGRRCTECHEHRFTDSHSGGEPCNTCHINKPVPRHSAFGLPRDCTKCHKGIRARMDIMGQFYANSHHVQNPDEYIHNKHCYPCHWEATEEGLINLDHHEGYNYKTHLGIQNDKVDLVVYAPGERPAEYSLYNDSTGAGTAITFTAMAIGCDSERDNVENITVHCLSCHSDQNNDLEPFDDCKTPRHYSWDGTSIDTRYSDTGTTTWGKYTDVSTAAPKNITKAFSAHGNAANNQGGYSPTTGVDGAIPNTRAGARNVQCFDCHSSHGSKVGGITSSYLSFEGTNNGANLKETQAGTGGYTKSYKATANPNPVLPNAYNPGSGQCFDCHETKWSAFSDPAQSSKTPWGYNDTFGASAPVIGYKDNAHFSGTHLGIYQYKKDSGKTTMGSHFNAEIDLVGVDSASPPQGVINGLCSPCHDPHGISPSLGELKQYAVPLLKGTYLTSPYREDAALNRNDVVTGSYNRYAAATNMVQNTSGGTNGAWVTDRNTFDPNYLKGRMIREDDKAFAGLCLICHPKNSLTDGANNNTAFKSLDRVHETVKGWGDNTEHNFPCSKCHQPHASGLPRLLSTNCLDSNHRGRVTSGGVAQKRYMAQPTNYADSFPQAGQSKYRYNRSPCHATTNGGNYLNQDWNNGLTEW